MSAVTPKVSIGIPVYNGERFIARAIDSILGQDFEDLELIISDNASTDATREICLDRASKDTRVRYCRNDINLGAARNFNKVFQLARGQYFKWAAHDDYIDQRFLKRCVQVLDEDPSVVLCFTTMGVVDDSGRVFRVQRDSLASLLSRSTIQRFHTMLWNLRDCTSPIFGLMRASALRQTGLIRNALEPDRILLGEMALAGPMHQLQEMLFFHWGPPGHPKRDSWVWLAPENAGKPRLATWRLLFYHAQAIDRTRLPVTVKTVLWLDLMCAVGVKRSLSKLRLWRKALRRLSPLSSEA